MTGIGTIIDQGFGQDVAYKHANMRLYNGDGIMGG
jgi:hypothetical protein